MEYLVSQIAKYLIIILFAVYTISSFTVLRSGIGRRREQKTYRRQARCMFAIHFLCYLVMFVEKKDFRLWLLYAGGIGLVLVIFLIYRAIYKNDARLITNHMCMLILLGITELTRLNMTQAVKQLEVAVIAVVVSIFVPQLIAKFKYLRKFTWLYAAVGVIALGAVFAVGKITYGAKLSFTVAGITVQPSEFVKLIFVFFVACMFAKARDFRQVLITTIVAAVHVLILVASNDLGTALIFYVAYIFMLYAATRKGIYLLGGFGVGIVAALAAAKFYSHVAVRVQAWRDPFAAYSSGGYQVAHSLFAIGTGGWLGTGIYQGMPEKIPVVISDFIFAGISEEFGGIFAICLILICFSCFIMMTNVAMQIHDLFYKLIALGFGCVYGFQVFLNIGGVTKCIPSTGVTLPFVSAGGSSIFCTILMFAIVQGLYIYRKLEGDTYERQIRSGQRPVRSVEYRPREEEPPIRTEEYIPGKAPGNRQPYRGQGRSE